MTHLLPGVSQTVYIHVNSSSIDYTAQVAEGTTVLGSTTIPITSSAAVYAVTFTPATTVAQLYILQPDTTGGNIFLAGADVPHHVDTIENGVSAVCSDDNYHYGFNGKYKDNEWAGLGNHYDYGARPYDPRIARFNRIDPLTRKFPMLTPYQFASNRCIDGIDIDGLEYATFNIYVNSKTGLTTKIELADKDYLLTNKGTMGAGVKLQYINEASGQKLGMRFTTNQYGLYQGGNNPQLPKVGESPYDLYDNKDLPPIDEEDRSALFHDNDFDDLQISGATGVFFTTKSSKANRDFINRANKVIEKYKNHETDDVTGKPVTPEAAEAAYLGKTLFEIAEKLKGEQKSDPRTIKVDPNNPPKKPDNENKKPEGDHKDD